MKLYGVMVHYLSTLHVNTLDRLRLMLVWSWNHNGGWRLSGNMETVVKASVLRLRPFSAWTHTVLSLMAWGIAIKTSRVKGWKWGVLKKEAWVKTGRGPWLTGVLSLPSRTWNNPTYESSITKTTCTLCCSGSLMKDSLKQHAVP